MAFCPLPHLRREASPVGWERVGEGETRAKELGSGCRKTSPPPNLPLPAGGGAASPSLHRLRTPPERKHLLPDETVRHVVADHAVFLGEFLRRLHGGAEQIVQEGVVRGVVLVDRLFVRGVVPVVEV